MKLEKMQDKMKTKHIKILYEDNHVIVVEKPINILSQQDKTKDPDMLSILKQDIKQRYDKLGAVYLGLVHRLDRPVGGTMVFAKTSKSASRLSEQIRNHQFKKSYLAVVTGIPAQNEGTLTHFVKKDTAVNKVSVVSKNTQGAKQAKLSYKILDTVKGLSLASINLHTGRPHQIRVQFASIGHALYGDRKYGSFCAESTDQIALWSFEISLEHPTKRHNMVFRSLPPLDSYPWSLFSFLYNTI